MSRRTYKDMLHQIITLGRTTDIDSPVCMNSSTFMKRCGERRESVRRLKSIKNMELLTPVIQEKRIFFFHDEEGHGQARINFVLKNDSAIKKGEWQFDGCDFDCKHQTYTLEEWEFLALLNAKIQELLKFLNK